MGSVLGGRWRVDRGSMGVWLLWFRLSRSQQDGLTFEDVAVHFAWEE